MELSLFPYKEDIIHVFPWAYYRKEKNCYLIGEEKREDYLPYLDVITHLKKTRDKQLWTLILQDQIKDLLSVTVLADFYGETDLQRVMGFMEKLLSLFPEHEVSRELSEQLATDKRSPQVAAAGVVARWNEMDSSEYFPVETCTIETLQPIDGCLQAYPGFIRFALNGLIGQLRSNEEHFRGAYLHGSLATLDFVAGSSDLDLVYVLSDETAQSPDAIINLRSRLQETTRYFYAIDSYQHHGPYILSPKMLSNYIECYLPLAVWRDSRPIIGPRKIAFDVCDSSFHRKTWFRRSVQYYRCNGIESKGLDTVYDAKLFVSMATLLPALACTFKTGRYVKKPDAMSWLRGLLNNTGLVDWLDGLTRIRADGLYGQSETSDYENVLRPERSLPVSEELRQLLTDRPFLQVAEICDRVLGVANRESCYSHYQKYFNFPRPVRREVYENINKKVVHLLKSCVGVTRVLNSGTINVPGISDIDYTIVTTDYIPGESVRAINGIHGCLGETERPVMMHPPMGIIPESLLSEVHWIFPVNFNRALYGQSPVFSTLTTTEQKLLKLIQSTDFAIAMNGRLFAEMSRRKEIDVRLLLNALNALRYSVEMLPEPVRSINSVLTTLSDIQNLRAKWFENPHFLDLSNFIHRATDLLGQVHKVIEQIWTSTEINVPEAFGFRSTSSSVDFSSHEFRPGYHLEGDEIVMHYPVQFAVPLAHYASLNGPLSQFLREKIPVPCIKQPGFLGDVLSHRGCVMNEHFRYLIENRLSRGFFAPFHFGWRFWD